MKEKGIENKLRYNFSYWGQFLFSTAIPEKITKKLLKHAPNKKSHHKYLAGHVTKQFLYPEDVFMDCLEPYLNSYLKEASIYYGHKNFLNKGVKLIGPPWINYMKAGDFNPPHIHNKGHFSMVIFLQIPKTLKKEHMEFKGTSQGPGAIEFIYGENRFLNLNAHHFFPQTGNFLMFPASLYHWVYPFKSKGERISISANLNIIT